MQHPDPAVRAAALNTIRELIDAGLAGNDEYDDTRFVVNAPQPLLDQADVALDHLGAEFLRTCPGGTVPLSLACLLPYRVRCELGLDEPDAPRLTMPLASRRIGAVV